MSQIDMSAKAVTARLKRVSQLRRLCLSLQKAKLPPQGHLETGEQPKPTPPHVPRKAS